MVNELRLEKLEAPVSEVSWSIGTPTPGVVLVEVNLGGDPAPLHWRVGLWDKPPLDVTTDQSGRLLGIQFVFQDECVHRCDDIAERAASDSGLPVFNVTAWPENRYLDIEERVDAMRTPAGTLVIHVGGVVEDERLVRVGDGLTLGLRGDALAEIRIGPLSVEDWATIDAFSFVSGQP